MTKQYIFLKGESKYRKKMIKILEIIGFILIGGTVYSYIGMVGNELRWPVFFGCAGGALAIIIYRKKIRQREDESQV